MKSVHLKGAFDNTLITEFRKELVAHFVASCGLEKQNLTDEELQTLRVIHNRAKLSSDWSKAYSSITEMKIWDKILNDYSPSLLQEMNLKPVAPLNAGIRIMEYQSERSYPLHQEWPDMETENFVILWSPLHDLELGDGCLLLEKQSRANKIEHFYNDIGYPVLSDEKTKDVILEEVPMSGGDCLVFDPFCIHGSAPMDSNSKTRFCFLIRYQIEP